ncbi:MAG: hypothetical protein AAF414_14970 [Pseudomonadota bacterium]
MSTADPLPPRRSYMMPRWLAALSIAVGIGLPVIFLMMTEGMAGATEEQMTVAMVMTIVLNVGYIVAPFLVGRGQWSSFFAGLLLVPAIAGWVSMFIPGVFSINPLVIVLAAISATALLGGYICIFRHFAAEFFSNRKGGGPT